FELRSTPNVDNGSACFAKKRGGRDNNPVGNAAHRHANDGPHSRCKTGVAIRQSQFHGKVSWNGPPGIEVQTGCGADGVDLSAEIAIGNCVYADRGGLTHFQLASLRLFDACGNLECRWMRKLGDSCPRPRAVAGLERSGATLWLPVVLQRNDTIERCNQGKRSEASFILLQLEGRLLALLLLARNIRRGGRAVRLERGLCFFEFLHGIRKLQFRLLAFDYREYLLFA